MWMSFMTSGVKILDEPSMYFLLSAGARDRAARPVAVRSMPPLPVVRVSATPRGPALIFTHADFALDFLAAFLAMTSPHPLFVIPTMPGSIEFPHTSNASRLHRLKGPGFR